MPILTKHGCNSGACHGASRGRGGFRLSLLGYDPEADHESITRLAGGRRVAPSTPEMSLLLRKPSLEMAHGGGKKFAVGSSDYRVVRDWIAARMPAPMANEPRVTRLEPVPASRTLAPNETQPIRVRAHYSDGATRDVTAHTLFGTSDAAVLTVTPDGLARTTGPGEAAVVLRYQGTVATSLLTVPFRRADVWRNEPQRHEGHKGRHEEEKPRVSGFVSFAPSWFVASPASASAVDRHLNAKWRVLGLAPSPGCTDAEFVRRAYLDLVGVLPSTEEVRAFLWDARAGKRERLIDALLERPEFVDFWTMKWGDMLRNSRVTLNEKGMFALNRWIRESVVANKPWDQFTRELLLARGSGFREGPANYYRVATSPEDLAETTAQLFLGVRLQCARCHNHPFEKWTQQQYYELAGFFARVRRKPGDVLNDDIVYIGASGEVSHPKKGTPLTPVALDAAPLSASFTGDRRAALAEWLTSPRNPMFARAIVNRLWRHFMGRGLVEPVDDLRATNPSTNEPLLNDLATDLASHGYDLKHLMRRITRSRAYQLSSRRVAGNAKDERYHSHFIVKRLGAEALLDALATATGVPEKFPGFPAGTRAAQLPDTNVASYFLDAFGRPPRQTTCDCERSNEPTVAQALHLMNSARGQERLASDDGRVARLIAAGLPPARIVEELYLATLSRYPTAAESRRGAALLESPTERRSAAEDLLWALLNSREFIFNR